MCSDLVLLSRALGYLAVIPFLALPAAAEQATASATAIPALIKQLGDSDFLRREEAADSLRASGERALPDLRKASRSQDFEIRFRAQSLVREIMIAAGKSRSTGMTLSLLDPGVFLMGSPGRESGRRADEEQHRVRISAPFLMGRYEVTQDEYRSVMKTDPSWFSKTGGGKDKVKSLDTRRFPVDSVSWFDAIAFCNALSKQDGYPDYYRLDETRREGDRLVDARVTVVGGNGYRLPTEAEWEYACRAGTLTAYHFGNGGNGRLANVKGIVRTLYGTRTSVPNLDRTTSVGSYKPNARGLYDMHGNVAEWCWDWYARDYPARAEVRDPSGPATGQHRVLRGGSWLVTESNARSASRFFHTPQERKFYTGFRISRSP